MKELTDKIAVVTGAGSGIGRAMAETFSTAGMKLVLSDIDQAALEKTAASLLSLGADVHTVVADVSKPEHVKHLADETLRYYGAVHLLCNNAGIGNAGGLRSWTSTMNDWRWIIGVNLMGVVHGVETFLPIMIQQDAEAHIVNTASLAGLVPGMTTLYTTTKFAVVGYSECLNLELRRGNFKPRISVLCPGPVDTNILESRRHRPAEFSNADSAPPSPAAQAYREWLREQLKQGLSARVVAEQVLAAIRDERFYILTHPEFSSAIEQRMRDILDGNNPTPKPIPGIELLMSKLSTLSTTSGNEGRMQR
jgi:NAD(P)-dependent dehydrogenase (short-subunit alcohol dehydrogenase family)